MYKMNPLTQQKNVLIKNSTTKNLNKTSLILVYEKKKNIHINKSYYYDIMAKSETYPNLVIFRYKTKHIVP